MNNEQGIELGDIARDTITGFEGVVISETYWLNGCLRFAIQPQQLKDGKVIESEWFDSQQVELVQANYRTAQKKTGGPQNDPKSFVADPKGF